MPWYSGVRGADAAEHEHHARGEARPQAGTVRVPKRRAKAHLAPERAHVPGAKRRELVCQQGLEALGARGEEFEGVCDAFRNNA